MEKRWDVVIIAFVAGAVRCVPALTEPIVRDGLDSVRFSQLPTRELFDLYLTGVSEPHPPLYYSFLHVWQIIAGGSDLAYRFPGLLFGVGTAVGGYMLVNHLFSRRAGLTAGLLIGIAQLQVAASVWVRMYSLFALTGIWSTYLLARLVQAEESDWQLRIGYVLLAVTMFYAHILGAAVILSQAAFAIVLSSYSSKKRAVRRWAPIYLATGLLCLPWVVFTVIQAFGLLGFPRVEYAPTPRPTPKYVATTVFARYFGFRGVSYTTEFLYYTPLLAALPAAVYTATAFVTTDGARTGWPSLDRLLSPIYDRGWGVATRDTLGLSLLVSVAFGPIAILFVESWLFRPLLHARWTIVSGIALLCLMAIGMNRLGRSRANVLLAVLLITGMGIPTVAYATTSQSPDWPAATDQIADLTDDQTVVILDKPDPYSGVDRYAPNRDYQLRKTSFNTAENVPPLAEDADHVVLIITRDHPTKPTSWLSDNYQLQTRQTVTGIRIYEFRRR